MPIAKYTRLERDPVGGARCADCARFAPGGPFGQGFCPVVRLSDPETRAEGLFCFEPRGTLTPEGVAP